MIILGLLPSFILALIVVGFFIMLLVQGENLTNPSLFESALNIAEADMISTAITIWVGLNIYNLTTKEELEDKIDERISKHLDSVKKKNAQTLENEIHKNAFIKELEKNRYRYAISDFILRHIERVNNSTFDGIEYKNVRKIEEYAVLSAQFYEKNQWKNSIKYAEKLFEIVNDFYIKDIGIVGQIYIFDRKGDAYFYLNSTKGRIEKDISVKELENAIICYKEEWERLKNIESEKMIRAYALNAIGYTYRLLCREININSNASKWYETTINIIEYGEKSLKEDASTGRYIRNTGIGYELLYFNFEKICNYIGAPEICKECSKILQNSYYNAHLKREEEIEWNVAKGIEKNAIEDAKKIVKEKLKDVTRLYYITAIRMDKEDYKGFNNIGAFYLKLLDEELGINADREDSIDNILSKKINDSNREELLSRVLEAEYCLVLAKEISETFEDCRYNFAKAKMYEYFCVKDVDKKENIKCQALEELKKMVLMKETIVFMQYILRNCYEAFNEIDKAIEVNNKLPSKGDKEKISQLYDRLKDGENYK